MTEAAPPPSSIPPPAGVDPGGVLRGEWLLLEPSSFWTLGLLVLTIAAAVGVFLLRLARRRWSDGMTRPVPPPSRQTEPDGPPSDEPDPFRGSFRGYERQAGAADPAAALAPPPPAEDAAGHPRLGNAGF